MATNDPLEGLADPIEGIDNILKEVGAAPPLNLPRLLFVRMREDEPLLAELAELLSDHLVDYAIPLRKRRQAVATGAASASGGSTAAASRLRREAERLLISFSEAHRGRYGEIGELLSYVVAIRFLGAAQIGSKMALKTSAEMPVHGVDGLHARAEDDGTMTFFVLESKIVPSAADASRDMVESIATYQSDRGRKLNELRLVNDLSNLDALEGDQREVAKSFFNVYADAGSYLKRRDVHVGSLVYSEAAYASRLPRDASKPITIHESNFESLYKAKHSDFVKTLARQAEKRGVDLGGCIVFLVAVPDVDNLKRMFNEHVRR